MLHYLSGFLNAMKICRETISITAGSLPLLSTPQTPELQLGRWRLQCAQQGVLNITNSECANVGGYG